MELILVEFSKQAVQAGDFTAFTRKFRPDRLPVGFELRSLMGTVEFLVGGYDHDPREIEAIPEVRRFYQRFQKEWPYWLYFCSLETDTLRTMTLCCMTKISVVQKDHSRKCVVEYDILELSRFLLQSFPSMNWCCERAWMPEPEIRSRTNAVFRYFDLPI